MIPLGRPRRRPRPSSSVAQDRIEDEGRGGGRDDAAYCRIKCARRKNKKFRVNSVARASPATQNDRPRRRPRPSSSGGTGHHGDVPFNVKGVDRKFFGLMPFISL